MKKYDGLLIQCELFHLFLVRGRNHPPQYLLDYRGSTHNGGPRSEDNVEIGRTSFPTLQKRATPEHVASPALVAFFFGSSAEASSYPLGLSAAFPFILGEPKGLSLGHFSLITTPLAEEGAVTETTTFGFLNLFIELFEANSF